MQILTYTFIILSVSGCWQPLSWLSTHQRIAYSAYTIIAVIVLHTFTLSQFLDLIINADNQDDFSDTLYTFLTMLVSCCKMCSILSQRANIKVFMDTLNEAPFAPMNEEEINIRKRFDKIAQSNAVRYVTLVEFTAWSTVLMSFFVNFGKRELTFRGWIPYNYNSDFLFSCTFIHQGAAFILDSLTNVGCDCLICGLIVHVCGQIHVLFHRLENIKGDGNRSLKFCALHHDRIYRFAAKVNKDFKVIIFLQFFVSTFVVCFSLYQITKTEVSSWKFVQLLSYMACMMTEIFFYCWYGNEIKVKSREIINVAFGLSWTTLNNDSKRMLLMIIRRATFPIEFSSAAIVSLNLDSYVNLLKTSYSVYNMLQQT